MTDVEELLRSSLRPDPATNGPSATESGWQAIEVIAAKRTRRRRGGQRFALISAILIVGAVMGRALTDETDDGTSVVKPPRLDDATSEGISAWSSAWTVAALVSATFLTIVAVSAWRRRHHAKQSLISTARTMTRRTLDHPRQLAAMTLVVVGLALPTWAYVSYVQSIGELQRRVPNLEHVESLDVVSVERTWSPFIGPDDPLLTVVATPVGSATETDAESAAIEELAAAGLEYVPVRGSYERAINPTDRSTGSAANDWSPHDAATVSIDDGAIRVDYRLRPETSRTWIPLAVFGATFIMAAATLGVLGTRLARPLGLIVLATTAGQVGLIVRAFAAARPLLVDLELDDTLAPKRAEVVTATTDVYPLGLLAVVLLLAPWLLGTVAVFGNRTRHLATVVGVGVVATVVVFVAFGSINGAVLQILE